MESGYKLGITYYFKNNDEKSEDLEKEMDLLDQEEREKDEVRNGDYEPIDFEEENLESDDYHFEDD